MSRPSIHVSRSHSHLFARTGGNEVTTLRHFIRSIDGSQVASILSSNDPSLLPAEISVREKIRVRKKEVTFRRVYLMDHAYKTGWVVDYDIDICMLCGKDFNWFRGRAKHHCRGCGLLICYKCSPNTKEVPYLSEEKVSRVCKECDSVPLGIMTPEPKNDVIKALVNSARGEEKFLNSYREEQEKLLQQSINRVNSQSLQKSASSKTAFLSQSVPTESFMQRSLSTSGKGTTSANRAVSPTPSLSSARVVLFQTPDDATPTTRSTFNTNSPRRASTGAKSRFTRSSSKNSPYAADDSMLDRYEEEMRRWEEQQRPLYEEAYRMMRELIPLDVYKSSMSRLVDQGLPILAANRIWNTKILWLICTHRDDIVKIHLADFRSKYAYDSLDLIEMRAIWYNLPEWDLYSSNPLEKGKAEWKDGFKAKLDEMTYKEARGSLAAHFCRHPAYDDCTLLHIFDPDIELRPRFHRSASFKQQAVESPMDMSRPLTKDEEEDLIWRAKYAATSPEPKMSIQDRKKAYMDNFREDDEDDDDFHHTQKQRNYNRLANEINGIDDDEDEEDYDGVEDDISSLGLESNVHSEANTPYHTSYGLSQSATRPYSNRLDITVNSIPTIPEMTTPESNSSFDRRAVTTTKEISPLPSPKIHKQPRSQLIQQQARPLSATSGANPQKKKSKAARHARVLQAEMAANEEEDEATKARAREEFLASRRAMASSNNSVSTAQSATGMADVASIHSGQSSSTNNTAISPQTGVMVDRNILTPLPLAGTVDVPTSETSRNSSFSTTASLQSRGNNSLLPTQNNTNNGVKTSSFSTTVSSHSTAPSAMKSRDASPLPPLRHQPLSPKRPELPKTAESEEDSANHRPFLPLTRNHTQVIDDKKALVRKVAIVEPTETIPMSAEEAQQDNAEDEEEEDDDINVVIENRFPTFFSPSEVSQPDSIGGDTFQSVESMEEFSLATPASSQSYKFLSHSKKFAVTIDDSPSVLLNTQQKRQQQRLLTQRSIDRARLNPTVAGGSLTPTIAQTLTYTSTHEKPTVLRTRGQSHDDLYQPGSDDRSYRRGLSLINHTTTVPTNTNDVGAGLLSPLPAELDQLVNDQEEVSPMASPYISSSQSIASTSQSQTNKASAVSSTALRADIMRALFEEDIELVYEYLGDEPVTSVFSSEADVQLLGRIFWQCLLMQRYQTVLFLIDEAVMGIDCVCEDDGAQAEQDGRSPLHYAVMENAESFGRQLIRRGANIFFKDMANESPLTYTLKIPKTEWLIEEYQQSGEESVLIANGSDENKLQYISHFILTGVPTKAKELLNSGKFSLTREQATSLLNACKGNFEQMEDPVDTFELLMSLDADMGD